MIDSDKAGFKKLLTLTYKMFGTQKLEDDVLRIWWQSLKDYSPSDIKDAFSTHIKDSKWLPRVKEIRDILDLKRDTIEAHKKVILLHHKHTAEERAANLARLKDITSELFKGVK